MSVVSFYVNCVVLCIIVLFYVLFLSTVLFYVLSVCKCVMYHCHRVSTQLQLTISYPIMYKMYMTAQYTYLFTNYIHRDMFLRERVIIRLSTSNDFLSKHVAVSIICG